MGCTRSLSSPALALGLLGALSLGLATVHAQDVRRGDRGAADGLIVERIRLPRAPTAPAGDRMLTLVRVDLSRYRLTVLTGSDGPPRPMPAWVRAHGLAGGINAGMFLPDRRPIGTIVLDDAVLSSRRPARLDAWLGWDPRTPGASPIGAAGRGCPSGQPALAGRYRSYIQGYRMMVDCAGRAGRWPGRRRYSAAAMGMDEDGRAVFLHVRTPYRMRVLNQMLASMSLGLRGLIYMEGGPEASLVVDTPSLRVREMGSWEDGFNANDDNREFWDLPNVVGFAPR